MGGRGEGAMTEVTFSVSDYGDDDFDYDYDDNYDKYDDDEEGGECNDLIDFFCFLARDHAAAGFSHCKEISEAVQANTAAALDLEVKQRNRKRLTTQCNY